MSNGEKWDFINKPGDLIVDFLYDAVGNFHEGVAAAGSKSNDTPASIQYGFIDDAGKVVIPLEYSDIKVGFYQGLAAAAGRR